MSTPFHIDVDRHVLPMLRLSKSAVDMAQMLKDANHFKQTDPKVKEALMGIPTSIEADISEEVSDLLQIAIEMLTIIETCKGGQHVHA